MARILSIEDDATLQHLIGQVLFSQGYELHYAFNGKEGYEKTLEVDPDLILLDLMLPIMNGVEFLKAVQGNKATRDIPVIVLTGYGDEVSMLEQSVRALGAVEYMRKPLRIQDLVAGVKAVLARHPRASRPPPPSELRKGAVRADPKFRTVWIEDRLVATLPRKRFELLRKLIEADGPVKKEDLLAHLWGENGQINALEKTIQRLREDFGPKESCRIQTALDGYELVG